jgi:4-amino-4-deoxy-L-arabinose transferase-like glycosyltransferase
MQIPTKLTINTVIPLMAVLMIGFTGIGGHDLWTPDEPRVAAISLEMAETGDFIVPRLAGAPFVEKPPLYFAAAALMLKIFGPLFGATAAIRLTTVMFGFGVLLMTFLIARRLADKRTAILAVGILATMQGFVQNFHWIRVDAALAFFVAAAAWCFVEIYFGHRRKLMPAAGFFVAGAFLSKGLIGPVLAATPWAGSLGMRIWTGKLKEFILRHMGMLVVFLMVSGIWIILLYVNGGPDIFREWFWVNHVERFTGQSDLGHEKPGAPLYYIVQIIMDGIPWTPIFIYWIVSTISRGIKNRTISREDIFLCVWGLGSIAVLTLPVTKRGLYLLPALPAFAVMAAVGLKDVIPRWVEWYSGFWTIICLALMALIGCLPLTATLLPAAIPNDVRQVLIDFSPYHAMAFAWLAACMILIFRYRKAVSTEYFMILMTTALFVNLLGLPLKAIDQEKSMGADIRSFVNQIPESQRGRVAGTDFTETMRGVFYYYKGWKVPQINDGERIFNILTGKDEDYDSMIVQDPEDPSVSSLYPVKGEMATGTHDEHRFFWLGPIK